MTTSMVDAKSLLVVDIGSTATRATLFDVVDGQYHYIANGEAPSTVGAPYRDVGESLHWALQTLEKITGRQLQDDQGQLILPARKEGNQGVDELVATYTAGPELRLVVAGLLTDVSLESVQRLAGTINARMVEAIGLGDARKMEDQVDAILNSGADLILLSGGTEGGASRSVYKLVEMVLLACRVLPKERRPRVIFAGNQALGTRIKEVLGKWAVVTVAPNIRPSVDTEDLGLAKEALADVLTQIRGEQVGGLHALENVCSVPPMPASHALGRMVQFLSKIYDPHKGVMGMDLGASGVSIAFAREGKLTLNVAPYGVGSGLRNLLEDGSVDQVGQWLSFNTSSATLRDALWQKSLYPASLPMTPESLAIEQAVARHALQLAAQKMLDRYPNLVLSYEPLIATGSVLTKAPKPAQALLTLLDGLQPVGVTTIVLDQNNLLASLGAVAGLNAILPVQILESGAFLNLGTVICPITTAKYGTPVLRVRLEYEDGTESSLEVKQGSIVSLPLHNGQAARIQFTPLRGTEIDPFGGHKLDRFKIVGGLCGAVVDARGRPLMLPVDATRRRELLQKWSAALGI